MDFQSSYVLFQNELEKANEIKVPKNNSKLASSKNDRLRSQKNQELKDPLLSEQIILKIQFVFAPLINMF
jgi:hypothetical protein